MVDLLLVDRRVAGIMSARIVLGDVCVLLPQLVDERDVTRHFRHQLVEAPEGSLVRGLPGVYLLVLG